MDVDNHHPNFSTWLVSALFAICWSHTLLKIQLFPQICITLFELINYKRARESQRKLTEGSLQYMTRFGLKSRPQRCNLIKNKSGSLESFKGHSPLTFRPWVLKCSLLMRGYCCKVWWRGMCSFRPCRLPGYSKVVIPASLHFWEWYHFLPFLSE